MKKLIFTLVAIVSAITMNAKTLVVYYSYTNNMERIVTELKTQIECDVIEVDPVEKGLDYAANNYAIGNAQIAAIRNNPDDVSSYPAIDPVNVDLTQYDTVIIGAPLWWSQMAAPLQTFLFNYGQDMAGKNIGVIVSSASSGISGVVADTKRLIPDGNFLEPSLWIRSSQTANAKSLIEQWLKDIDYSNLTAGIGTIDADEYGRGGTTIYTLNGNYAGSDISSLQTGIYIVNQGGKSTKIKL
ncbi:MAG: flavodoxin [Muribaculum sp.]|nr:flavodoxin [Muribaculum sp.]